LFLFRYTDVFDLFVSEHKNAPKSVTIIFNLFSKTVSGTCKTSSSE
jgi:hypothetical protein